MIFWDLSKLSIEDLEEISHLASALSLDQEQAFLKWIEMNPGKVENMGELKDGEFKQEIISENGVKTNTDIAKMLRDVIERKNK